MQRADGFVGAVLTGGTSRRMGRPKALLPMPDGTPMAAAVATTLEQLCHEVVIVGAAEPALARWRCVPDRRGGLGPLGGIEALLASGLGSAYLVCPCDVPLVTAALLECLATPAPEPVTAFMVTGERDPRPLPLRIDGRCLGEVERLLDSGRRAVADLLGSLERHVVTVADARVCELMNVNTPEDFAALGDLV